MIEKDRVFLSYARADDHPDFKDPQKSLLRRLYNDLSNNGFDVWWDRESMPSRALSFLQEIRMAIDDADRFVLVIGPEALNSKYVRAEWEYALSICKPIVPILKHGNYDLIPQPLGGFHCVDFRNSQDYSSAFQELSRVLMDSIPSLANLIGVPSLPPNYLHRSGDINYLKQLVIVDLLDPTTIASSIQTTGLYGIAGIGKTVVASAFARDCDTRRAFHGGIVWLTLGQDKTPLAVLSSLETLLDATNSTEFTTEDQARLHLREILAEDNYLIIMDNVCSAEQIAPVREILPANCHLLFTTRDEKISRIIAGTNCLELKAFSSQLAIEFLRNQVDASESELMDTANRTKGIPDLLAVVAQQLDNDPLSKMHTWASNVSLEELERIPREKWNPLTPELYITRTKIERSLHDFLEASSTSNRGFCVLGDTGLGKTNLLCREYQRLHTNHHANSRDVLIFQSAKSLDERLGNNSLDVFLDNVILETLFSEQEVSISSDRTERISQALRWLGTLSNGRGIRFIIIVDAINELPEQDMFPFLMKLTRGIDALRNRNSDTNDSMYVSLIVSCRTFPWQTLWGGRELELNGYFGNLARDMDGEIKENLFEFDLSTEAREAYQKANIQPAWEELEDDFQYLCCNPFFLNIIKLIAHNRASVIQGTYFDVMNRYDEIVLRANRTGWESIQDANIRTAVLREMMLLLVDSEETPQTFGSEEASYNVLTRHLNERYHFQALEIEATLKGLLEDNVLEARGQKIRFAFDRYFDYRFSLHLNEKSKIERWQGPEWANLLDRFHRSSYHRNGVCMALTHKITYEQSPTSAVDFLKYLLEQDRAVAASYRELILNALKQYGEEEPTELTNILLILDTVVNDPFAITEVTCDVIASSRVRWSSKQYLMTVLQQVISRHLQNRRASENEAIRRNLINTIGGLGRTEQGPKLIIEVLRNLLGMDQQIGGLPEFLDVVFEAFLSNDFQTALTKIRVRTLRAFNEDITRVKLILLILRISITTPSMVIAVAKRIGLIRYSKLIARLLSQFDLFFEIVVKGVAMFVTERENLSDAEFRTHLSVVDDFAFGEVLYPVVEVYNRALHTSEYRDDLLENLAFVLMIGLWPEVNRWFSYSERGLDYLAHVLKHGDGQQLAELLAFFDYTNPISPEALDKLRHLYYVPDAFRNYLAMLCTIIQASKDFSRVEHMLWEIMTDATPELVKSGSVEIPLRVKLSREVLSIFTYILRRTASTNLDQLDDIVSFIFKITEHFFAFDPEETSTAQYPYLMGFLKDELFEREDPFNPLLPLGVAAQQKGYSKIRLNNVDNYPLLLIDRFYGSQLSHRVDLIARVLQELVPMAYFAPHPVMGSLAEIIVTRKDIFLREEETHKALVSTLRHLRLISKGHTTKLFQNLEIISTNMERADWTQGRALVRYVSKLEAETYGTLPAATEVRYLYHSVDVFGGHDLITTMFVEYKDLSNVLVFHLRDQIVQVMSASELVLSFVKTLIAEIASDAGEFSITKVLFPKENTP